MKLRFQRQAFSAAVPTGERDWSEPPLLLCRCRVGHYHILHFFREGLPRVGMRILTRETQPLRTHAQGRGSRLLNEGKIPGHGGRGENDL